MKTSASIELLAAALAAAQGEIEGAKRDSTNPHFKSQYADLSSCVAAIKAPFAKHGLSYVQTIVTGESGVGVETMLMHSSGQFLLGDAFYIPVVKMDAQGFGSALTYGRRYSLAAMTGLAPADDDGNAASGAAPKPLSTAEYAKHKAAINDAEDELTLKKAYTAAYVAANVCGDADAVKRLTDLKDLRKEQLAETAKQPIAYGSQG